MSNAASRLWVLFVLFFAFPGLGQTAVGESNEVKLPANDTQLDDLNGPIYSFILQEHRQLGERFKAGDTNTPILILEWFINERYVQSSRVTKSWLATLADYGRFGGSGRGGFTLDSAQQEMLIKTINELPVPPLQPPQDRWLLVSGIRSNRWFTCIYDRADIPASVEKLYEITRGRIEWIVADVVTSTNVPGRFQDTWVTSLRAAKKAPLAISSSAPAAGRSVNGIQLWDTQNWKEVRIPAIEEFTTWPWTAVALTSNGQFVVIGAQYVSRDVERSSGAIRWENKLPDINQGPIKQLAFLQDDKRLAVALRNSVEVWDSSNGSKLDVLVTNSPEINLLNASRDGKLLAVGCAGNVQVWDINKREVLQEKIDDPQYIYAIEFSPDGKYLAVSGFSSRGSFVLWNLDTAIPQKIEKSVGLTI